MVYAFIDDNNDTKSGNEFYVKMAIKIKCKDCKKVYPESKIIMRQYSITQGGFDNEVENKLIYVCEKCSKKRDKEEKIKW